jgi:hypothetical protein
VVRDTPFVIFQTSEKLFILCLATLEGFFICWRVLQKVFFFVTKYLVHLSFMYFILIGLLINVCKLLSDHLLMDSKQEKQFWSGIITCWLYRCEIYFFLIENVNIHHHNSMVRTMPTRRLEWKPFSNHLMRMYGT